ncbi:MAG TPA: hypothetical protein VF395_12065 [Polyangiaceae bacterium]
MMPLGSTDQSRGPYGLHEGLLTVGAGAEYGNALFAYNEERLGALAGTTFLATDWLRIDALAGASAPSRSGSPQLRISTALRSPHGVEYDEFSFVNDAVVEPLPSFR